MKGKRPRDEARKREAKPAERCRYLILGFAIPSLSGTDKRASLPGWWRPSSPPTRAVSMLAWPTAMFRTHGLGDFIRSHPKFWTWRRAHLGFLDTSRLEWVALQPISSRAHDDKVAILQLSSPIKRWGLFRPMLFSKLSVVLDEMRLPHSRGQLAKQTEPFQR